MIKKSSISSVVRLILLTGLLSLFFGCSTNTKDSEKTKEVSATEAYWAIPEPYKNLSIEQIKSQIEITDYMTIKGAATDAATESRGTESPGAPKQINRSLVAGGAAVPDESPKNKADREALASYANKLISLEGVVNTIGTQKNSPLDIQERIPGKYEIWFCADKNQKRKPCRYRAYLLYEAPKGKGDTLFTHDNVMRFWGVVLEEQIGKLFFSNYTKFKRYPKIRVIDLEVIK
jgi:hypothetical protein